MATNHSLSNTDRSCFIDDHGMGNEENIQTSFLSQKKQGVEWITCCVWTHVW